MIIMARKLTFVVLLSMIVVLLAAPLDSDNESPAKRIRIIPESSDSEAENNAERSRSGSSSIESLPDETLSQRTIARVRPASASSTSDSDHSISEDISSRDSSSDSYSLRSASSVESLTSDSSRIASDQDSGRSGPSRSSRYHSVDEVSSSRSRVTPPEFVHSPRSPINSDSDRVGPGDRIYRTASPDSSNLRALLSGVSPSSSVEILPEPVHSSGIPYYSDSDGAAPTVNIHPVHSSGIPYYSDSDGVVPTVNIHSPDSASERRAAVGAASRTWSDPHGITSNYHSEPTSSVPVGAREGPSWSRSYTYHLPDAPSSPSPEESQPESNGHSPSRVELNSDEDAVVPDMNPRRVPIPDSSYVQQVPSDDIVPSSSIGSFSESEHSPGRASLDEFIDQLSDGPLTPMSSDIESIPESIRSSEVSWSNYLEIPRPAENFQPSNPGSSGIQVSSDNAGPSHSNSAESPSQFHPGLPVGESARHDSELLPAEPIPHGNLDSAGIKATLDGKSPSPSAIDHLLRESMQPGSSTPHHDSDLRPVDQQSVDWNSEDFNSDDWDSDWFSDSMSDRTSSTGSEDSKIELLQQAHGQAIAESAKKPHPVILYGRETSLQKLFDYAAVNEQDIYHPIRKHTPLAKYSDRSEVFEIDTPASEQLDTALDGIQYIERYFIRKVVPSVYRPPSPEPSTSQDVPAAILRSSPEAIAIEMLDGKQRFAVIMGNEGTGKTVSIKRIAQYLREYPADIWPIYVDLSEVNFASMGADWDPKHIFKNVLSGDNLKLFLQVLKYNPSKVYVLFDNIDRIPLDWIEQLPQFLNGLNNAGTKIMVTTTEDLNVMRLMNGITISIPPPSHSEIVRFLTSYWENKIGPNPLINDYTSVLTKNLIDNTDIPRNFYVMMAICEVFEHTDSERSSEISRIFVDNTENNFISLREYINRDVSDPGKILTMLKAIKFDKYNFYTTLIESMPRTGTFDPSAYGSIALNRILISRLGQGCASNEAFCSYIRYLETSNDNERVRRLMEKPQYIHSIFSEVEIENFFAARYVTLELVFGPGANHLLDVAMHILQKPELHALAEYFNSDKHSEVLQEMCQLVRRNPDSAKNAIQNAIIYGFDDIASTLLLEFNGQAQIPPLDYTLTSDNCERIIQSNMKKTILALNRFLDLSNPNFMFPYEFYLLKLLSQPNPSVEIYQFLKNELFTARRTGRIPTSLANDLLYEVIKNSGMERLNIINDLMANGAQLSTDTATSEKIILQALEKRDPQLLRYIVEEMSLPIVDDKASILINVLDTNPFSRCSMPRFWETMEYLVATAGDNIQIPLPNYLPTASRDSTVTIPAEFVGNSAYELLLGYELPADNIAEVKSSSAPLDKFPLELKHMRRRLVLDGTLEPRSTNCLTEILLKYRGTDTLTPEEQTAYERSVSKALERDFRQNALNPDAEKNIVKLLTDNMATEVDAVFTRNLLSQLLSRSGNSNQLTSVINSNFQSEEVSPPYRNGLNPFESTALETRARIYSWSSPQTVKSLRKQIMEGLHQAPCPGFSRRRRRSALNCLISEKEYSKLVKVDKYHGKRRQTLDTDKFMEILNVAEFSDRPKYKQLIGVGKRLLEDKGTRLGGDYTEDFRKKVLPNSLERNFKSQKSVESNYNLDEPAQVKSNQELERLDIWKKHSQEPVPPSIHSSVASEQSMPSNYFKGPTEFGRHIITPNSETMAPYIESRGPTTTFSHQLGLPYMQHTMIQPSPLSNVYQGSQFNFPYTVFEPTPKISIPHVSEYTPLSPKITPILRSIKYG